MFGRATISLGIGPHSSVRLFSEHLLTDIDECVESVLRRCAGVDDLCVNTRGGHLCQTITCPAGFVKAPMRAAARQRRLTTTALCPFTADVSTATFKAKFSYASWFEAGRRPASNQLRTS